jgi:hypothetical protein
MAEKRPKSILSGLKNMLHRDSDKPSKPAPKKSSAPPKKPASAEKRATPEPKEQRPAPAPAEAAGAPDAVGEPKPDKKVKQQPWYRHRQRW